MTDTRLRLDAVQAKTLAEKFGTPLYVLEEKGFRDRLIAYRQAWESRYPKSRISFASKANSTLVVLRIAHEEGYHIDVASLGELEAARRAGVPAKDCTLHGNAKPDSLLHLAAQAGIGEIVVDSLPELERILTLGIHARLVLRVNPGVVVATNAKIATGHGASKFGLPPDSLAAAFEVLRSANRVAYGLHCHLGSNIQSSEGIAEGARRLVEVASEFDWTPQLLNFGGGLGVRYVDETPPSFDEHAQTVLQGVLPLLQAKGWEPTLGQEPGRALIAEAGLTLLKVVTTKKIDDTIFVSVDGGLFENPRPTLYDARYQAEIPGETGDAVKVTIVGSHCENDVLYPDVPLPRLPTPGDLVQVLTTGAYCASMASNYNRFVRPATVLIRESGTYDWVQRRETLDQLFEREILPADLWIPSPFSSSSP